ncbi:hypothetical protein C8R46DRAFT_1027512 [Mycena filopes]|nr:hypothetical protein C8R46DRAFT_1027512 [Mycena filopes]
MTYILFLVQLSRASGVKIWVLCVEGRVVDSLNLVGTGPGAEEAAPAKNWVERLAYAGHLVQFKARLAVEWFGYPTHEDADSPIVRGSIEGTGRSAELKAHTLNILVLSKRVANVRIGAAPSVCGQLCCSYGYVKATSGSGYMLDALRNTQGRAVTVERILPNAAERGNIPVIGIKCRCAKFEPDFNLVRFNFKHAG